MTTCGMHGKQLHLFRYVISYQQAKYIVDNYKGEQTKKTDKLYSQRENLELDSRGVYEVAS